MTDKELIELYKYFTILEERIASYCGSKYCVLVDSCTSALFLCFLYYKPKKIILPSNTYIGVATAAHFNNIEVEFNDINWSGIYKIDPLPLYDSARRFTSNMYIKDSLMCLSFHYKKILKIGKGGAIILDDKNIYNFLIKARNCGKDINKPLPEQEFNIPGLNFLMHPELALKGVELMNVISSNNDDLPDEHYGDLQKQFKLIK